MNWKLGWLWLAIACLLTAMFLGCQWAKHVRTYDAPQSTVRKTTEGKRYFRVRMKDGTVRYAWRDSEGNLHMEGGAK